MPSEQVAQDDFSGAVRPSPSSVLGGMVTLCPGPAVGVVLREGKGASLVEARSLAQPLMQLGPCPSRRSLLSGL